MPRNLTVVADAVEDMLEAAVAADEDETVVDAILANIDMEFPDLTPAELRAAVRIADRRSGQ